MADQVEERYPGEWESLKLFLEGLTPAVDRLMGHHSMLAHAIRRSFRHHGLRELRHAKDLFNHLPRAQRDELSNMLIEKSGDPTTARTSDLDPRDPGHQQTDAAIIRFEASSSDPSIRVSRTQHIRSNEDVAVDIRPGTLPSFAAARLRLIAGSIEANKSVLSDRSVDDEGSSGGRKRNAGDE